MEENEPQAQNINLNLETTPIYYINFYNMNIEDQGVAFDLGQRIGNTNQIKIVARIAITRNFAKKVANDLSKLLAMSEGQIKTEEKN